MLCSLYNVIYQYYLKFTEKNEKKIKASILWRSALFTVQLSHPYMTTGKTIALTKRTFVGKVMSAFEYKHTQIREVLCILKKLLNIF